jgi:hypothetical protein
MDKEKKELWWLNLTQLAVPVKLLFTGYLVVISFGFLAAGLQIFLTHGMADGKPGVSIEDIVYSYYGNRTGSKLEKALNGSMKEYAKPEERLKIIEWVRKGAPEDEMKKEIMPIIQKRCAVCHQAMPDLNLIEPKTLKKLAEIDTGASINTLTRDSHIHLFGMAFIFILLGFIFSFSIGLNVILKSTLILIPFVFQLIDIFAWWITKFFPEFAYFVIIGGFGYFTASGLMILISLYQMWIKKPTEGNAWELCRYK